MHCRVFAALVIDLVAGHRSQVCAVVCVREVGCEIYMNCVRSKEK
jgi:hypothetical protein